MDAALTSPPVWAPGPTRGHGLLVTALSPVAPQFLGSAFNIWYNAVVVNPLLSDQAMRERFAKTVIAYNAVVYPLAIGAWLWLVYSLSGRYRQALAGAPIPADRLACARRRVVNLPWLGALVSGFAWLLCVPVFLLSLRAGGHPLSPQLLWHLPISFFVSAFISITQSLFLIELATHWELFPVFFQGVRPDRIAGIHPLSLRARGLMWAISAGLCPIGSLLLLGFAPPLGPPSSHWFQLFVGIVGVAFGLCSALLLSRLVAQPLDQLRTAAQAVAEGNFDVHVPLRRADEFGALIGEFNRMVAELREKQRLRQMFGLHIGRQAAEQILARDPGLNGREQVITVMFVDIRDFTARADSCDPQRVVGVLNEFLREMVRSVEEAHSGMINKFLGDGFMALFGIGDETCPHADQALRAACDMRRRLRELNVSLEARGEMPVAIGIGLHCGPAIVGSIGSPERLEFTAIGSTVNLAARIETLTKTLGVSVLLTEPCRRALRETYPLETFSPQTIRGVSNPVQVWAPSEEC